MTFSFTSSHIIANDKISLYHYVYKGSYLKSASLVVLFAAAALLYSTALQKEEVKNKKSDEKNHFNVRRKAQVTSWIHW